MEVGVKIVIILLFSTLKYEVNLQIYFLYSQKFEGKEVGISIYKIILEMFKNILFD